MLSRNRKKWIRSLSQKKVRQAEGLFLAEGDRILKELLDPAVNRNHGYRIHTVLGTGDWMEENREFLGGEYEIIETSPAELRQVSALQSPNRVMAVVHTKELPLNTRIFSRGLTLGLYRLRDPGNLGTILRSGDWFGVRDIVCSPDSVDLHNPKVIQSSMGSFLRVSVYYADLAELVRELKTVPGYPVYATGMQGENIFESNLDVPGLILMGSESMGLPQVISSLADRVLRIPPHEPSRHAESLNVAMAASIICAEFRRRKSLTRN